MQPYSMDGPRHGNADDQAMARQTGWAEAVLDGLSLTALGDATDALRAVRRRLDEQHNCDGQGVKP